MTVWLGCFIVSVFDPVQVNQDRTGPDPDRILVAQITGTARHHARWRQLTGAAVAELRELASGRADLLAEVRRPGSGRARPRESLRAAHQPSVIGRKDVRFEPLSMRSVGHSASFPGPHLGRSRGSQDQQRPGPDGQAGPDHRQGPVRGGRPGGPRRNRTTQARIRCGGGVDGDSSHAICHPSVAASGWASPVSAARAAATSARLART